MAGYWDTVPVGVWTITDPQDALEVLKDNESFAYYNPSAYRVHVLGPFKKATIIDLGKIVSAMGLDESAEFLKKVSEILGNFLTRDLLSRAKAFKSD